MSRNTKPRKTTDPKIRTTKTRFLEETWFLILKIYKKPVDFFHRPLDDFHRGGVTQTDIPVSRGTEVSSRQNGDSLLVQQSPLNLLRRDPKRFDIRKNVERALRLLRVDARDRVHQFHHPVAAFLIFSHHLADKVLWSR